MSEKTLADRWWETLVRYNSAVQQAEHARIEYLANIDSTFEDMAHDKHEASKAAVHGCEVAHMAATRALIVKTLELASTDNDVELWHKTAKALLPDRTEP